MKRSPVAHTVVFDCQLFQTEAWGRGMGRYMQEFLRAFALENTKYDRIVVLLNKNLPCSPERLQAIQGLSPDILVDRVALPTPRPQDEPHRRHRYITRLTDYVARLNSEQTDFILSSLFMFEYFAEYPTGVGRGVILYDLIPFIYWEAFSSHYPLDKYFMRFKQLLEADHIFAISQAVRDDTIKFLGIAPQKVTSINGACISREPETKHAGVAELGLQKPFVVLPTGALPHKNNRLALAAFAELNAEFAGRFQLAVTSRFSPAEQRRLQAYCPDAVFVGNVSDDTLHELYERSVAVMIPSEYEGLGLPVLEAVAQNKPVVCSRIPVFEEISADAFYFFDSKDRTAAVGALRDAIAGTNWNEKHAQYAAIGSRYTWLETAKSALDTMPLKRRRLDESMPSVALVAPHPAIAPYTEALVQALVARTWDSVRIEVYFDAGFYHEKMRPSFLQYAMLPKVLTGLTKKTAARYDHVLYVFDAAAPDCMGTLLKALELPGSAVFIGPVEASTGFTELVQGGHLPAPFMVAEAQLNASIKAEGYDPARLLATLVKSQKALVSMDAQITSLHNAWAPEVPLHELAPPTNQEAISSAVEQITGIIQAQPTRES